MLIPIITIFTDVVRLFTFQPQRVEGGVPRPCPEAEAECSFPSAIRPAAAPARTAERHSGLQNQAVSQPKLFPHAERC
ncbi:hypothetical protein [Shinella sp. M27]|uniref:hypothetical protein n=1 Tax=Shinella sp. M27 TaxID=3368614 RepID=UPI003BA22773